MQRMGLSAPSMHVAAACKLARRVCNMHAWSYLDVLGASHTSEVGDPSPVYERGDLLASQSDGRDDHGQLVVDGSLLLQL